jgi:WD40 repeat protein
MYATTNLFGPALASAVLSLTVPFGGESGPSNNKQPEPLLILRGHSERVVRVRFSADGKLLATAGGDHVACLWDAATGKKLHTLKGHAGYVDGLAFNRDGTLLATNSANSVKIWATDTGREVLSVPGNYTFGGSNAVAFCNGGQQIITAHSPFVDKVKGRFVDELTVWNAKTGKPDTTLQKITNGVLSLTCSNDGRRLASGNGDGSVVVWEVASFNVALTLSAGHRNSVLEVAFSPDSKRLATASFFGHIKVWDLPSDQAALSVWGHTGHAFAVQFSPDGKLLASAGNHFNRNLDGSDGSVGQVRLWDALSGKELSVLQGTKEDCGSGSVAFSPDGKRLATAHGDGTVRIWDVAKLLSGKP